MGGANGKLMVKCQTLFHYKCVVMINKLQDSANRELVT